MDQDRAGRVIGRVYETALDPAAWEAALDDIAGLAGADAAWMVVVAPRLGLNSVVAPRSDPGVIADYQRFWWERDPTLEATFRTPVGWITSLRDSGRDRFLGSSFYNDFWRRSGHATERLSANLIREEGAIACIGVQPSRRRDSIGTDLAGSFRLLVPHLVRSIRIGCELRRIELEREMARGGPRSAVLLVDAGCRLVAADPEAERLLACGASLRLERGTVELGTAAATRRLRALVASCRASDPALPRGGVVRAPGEGGLAVRVLPFCDPARRLGPELVRHPRATAMLCVSAPARERELAALRLRQRFGLTPAEAAVTLELARGDGRAAVAQRLGVTLATVRTHMMRVFEKVGVSRQAGLLAAIAQAGVALELIEADGAGERQVSPD